MEATFTYSRDEVEKIVVNEHALTFHEPPKGYRWQAKPDVYGMDRVKVELVKEDGEAETKGEEVA